ncbi:MAG: protein kinase, partial [Planctomycetes bacterium]|nr:protein kinase [Planctomycetota bacterium]
AADPTARARFIREARSAMAVEHDHVVAVYQVGVEDETPFLVMPALKGESLEDRLGREPLPPIGMVLKIGREVALGLSAAHEKGLVHRDVKPANTWLEGDPASSDPMVQVRRAKVLDFGLARAIDGTDGLSLSGSVVGTPAYMAPEQAGGRAVDARADLFSLGAILYRMAAGRPAFSGPTITAVLTAIATHQPPPPIEVNPAVPPALSALIMQLLEKEPGDRPVSAQAVAEAVAALETAQPLPAKSPRRRAVAIGLSAGVLLLGVGVWAATKPANTPVEKPKAADPVPPATPPVVAAVGPVTYKGSVDLLVHRKDMDGSDLAFPLSDVRAWPLKPGDSVKVTAEVEPAAFVYLFWIDETGTTYPIYPWTPLKWGTRPASEQKASRLEVKDPNGNWFKIGGKDAGMETLQMIARTEPLTATDAEIQGWFRDLRPLAFAGEKAKAWFEGFDLVKHDPLRAPEYGGETGQDNSPLGQQAILGQRIGKQSDFGRAISFSRLGSKGGK